MTDVGELPAHTYLSVRYGDKRQQAPFRRGEKFSFPTAPEKAYTVDVFRKVGSKQISLAGISAIGGVVASEKILIPSLEPAGSPLEVSLTASLSKDVIKADPASMKQQVAQRAKGYLDKHQVQPVLHDMFARLLERLPTDPLTFMISFLEEQRQKIEDGEAPERDFASEPGMGDVALPGFGDQISAEALPNLSAHHSQVADVLRGDEKLYPRLKDVKTSLGVSLAQCIKPGIDCPGHEFVKVAGAYAGDDECYEQFRDLFDPIISGLHGGYRADARHPTDMNPSKISNAMIDPTGRYALFATLETRRNLTGIRLPTCCSQQERREVERVLTRVLGTLDNGNGDGTYYPLRLSQSYVPKAGGMAPHQEEQMRRACTLFTEPDSRLRLSAGFGRHWPDARGIYVNEAESFYVWCNEEDHVRFFARQHNVDVKVMWTRIAKAVSSVEKGIQAEGRNYMKSEHLGFIASCPSRLGTGLRISVSLKIPLLAASVDLPALCRSLQLQSSQEVGSVTYGSLWNITNTDCLGVTEVDILNCVIEGAQALVQMEQKLERGEPIYDACPGMGSEPYPGFPDDRCPVHMPDLSGHHSLVALVLKEDPTLYGTLRSRRTEQGDIGLAPCIKVGMDERGQANAADPAPGFVACNEECFSTFAELFNPVLARLHPGFGKHKHPNDSNPVKFSNAQIDPRGAYVVSVRVELRRNFSGLKMSPCCGQAERREAERLIVKGLLGIGDSCEGSYMPLTWSESYVPKPTGMPAEDQAKLRDDGLLFAEPTAPARLSMGLGRHWPDARGIFLGTTRDFYAWCNEEDHLCIVVKADDADLKGAVVRAQEAAAGVEAEAQQTGSGFMKDERLGFLTVNPVNLGNGCSCSVSLRLGNLGTHSQFRAVCQALDLRCTWRDGAWEISSMPNLGVSQADSVTGIIEGCSFLVSLEEKLEQGTSIDDDLREIGAIK